MKTNSKNHPVFPYLIGCISEEFEGTTPERIKQVLDAFNAEYNHPSLRKRHGGAQNTFREWLMGLPSALNIDFENYKILELAYEWGSLKEGAKEAQEWRIIENWFSFISVKFFQLCKFNKVDTSFLS